MGLLAMINEVEMKIPRFDIKYLFKYIFKQTLFRVFPGATVNVGPNVKIFNSKIIISPGAEVTIGPDVNIKNAEIYVERGCLRIDEFSLIQGGNSHTRLLLVINDGKVSIGHHSKISCEKIWVRFGGNLTVGNYTNINKGSEIRCDERISIGSYNQISYRVKIWDTNTHNILSKEERRIIAEKYYPYFGYENSKPVTSAVSIGDDCWLSEDTAILKGSQIGDGSIIGFRTTLAGKTVPSNSRVVQDIILKMSSIHNQSE